MLKIIQVYLTKYGPRVARSYRLVYIAPRWNQSSKSKILWDG